MDQHNQHYHHPSASSHCDTDRFPGFQPWNTQAFDVKKKRKLLIDQLSLPTPKLPRLGRSKSSSFPHGEVNKKPQQGEKEEEREVSFLTKVAMEGKEQVQMQGENDISQWRYGHEEDLLEFGSQGHSCPYEQFCSDDSAHQSLLLLPTDSKHDFVLSSGRWSVDSEEESKTIKPTIDQEFEQYFSVLLPSFDP